MQGNPMEMLKSLRPGASRASHQKRVALEQATLLGPVPAGSGMLSGAPRLLDQSLSEWDLAATQEVLGFQLRRFAGPEAYVGEMEPLRVVQLTDLHVGRITPIHVHLRAIDITNALAPDVVVITGDFVCHGQGYLDELTAVVGAIEAPVFCVLGNHDHWSGAREVRWALGRAGAEVLSNVSTVVKIDGQALQLVGLDDAYTGHANVRDAVQGMRRGVPTLGLSHIAEEADAMWLHGVPFVLSGHTHGGQVTVARLHELALGRFAGHRYVHGLYGNRLRAESNPGALYVGAGIGASVMPLRIGDRGQREITVFDLGLEPGAFSEHHLEQAPMAGRKPSRRKTRKRVQSVRRRERRRAIGRVSWVP